MTEDSVPSARFTSKDSCATCGAALQIYSAFTTMKTWKTLSEYCDLRRSALHKSPSDRPSHHRFACANWRLGRLAAQRAGVWNIFPSRPSSQMRTLVGDQNTAAGGDSESTCPDFADHRRIPSMNECWYIHPPCPHSRSCVRTDKLNLPNAPGVAHLPQIFPRNCSRDWDQ